jgi:hypothetical protein
MSLEIHRGSIVEAQLGRGKDSESSSAPTANSDSRLKNAGAPRWVRADRLSQIRQVSVLPAAVETVGKSSYRMLLSLDPKTDPSSRSRRTGTLEGLEFEVDEKELTPLIRLAGREILVRYVIWDKDDDFNTLKETSDVLRRELEEVRRKLRETQDQLRISIESQLRDQR